MASTGNWFKVVVLVTGVIFVVLFGTAGLSRIVKNPEFCTSCHAMKPEFATWKASSHLQVACVDCHLVKKLLLCFRPGQKGPVKMGELIGDEICNKCHSSKRQITPSGDLLVPHDKHAAKDVLCMDCHNAVGHGNIASRKVTEDVEKRLWTPEFGAKQMSPEFTEPKMNVCLDCHIKRGITQACEACHTSITLPPDHKEKGWGALHGKKARADLAYCNNCHSYSLEAKDVPIEDRVARYARGNVFCYECHQKRPAAHNQEWKMLHKRSITNRDVSGCTVCHNLQKSKPLERSVPTYCAKCHGKQDLSGSSEKKTFSKLHPPNWRKLHPPIVKEKGASNEGCWDCHDTVHCSKCHMNKL